MSMGGMLAEIRAMVPYSGNRIQYTVKELEESLERWCITMKEFNAFMTHQVGLKWLYLGEVVNEDGTKDHRYGIERWEQ